MSRILTNSVAFKKKQLEKVRNFFEKFLRKLFLKYFDLNFITKASQKLFHI